MRGVRVVDFCSNIAGPMGSMILAQLGADVIAVESPRGDDSRSYGTDVVHRYVGAGKRGVVLDLKQPDGVTAALDLIASADVVLQSMRPGVADRIGIGRDAARGVNPSVLYYDVNAFGTGPLGRDRPGYDPLVQAFSGIMEMNGHDGTPPTRCAPSVVDLGTGQWVAMGVLGALLARARGETVDDLETSLVDTAFSLVAYQATNALVSGRRPPRAGSGNPIAAPYECFRTSDGWLLLAAPSQRLWERAARALGLSGLVDDPRYATVADRTRHRDALADTITAVTRTRTVAEWVERLAAEGVPSGTVNGLEEAVTSDVAAERGTFLDSADPGSPVPLVRLPWLADGAPLPWRRPAPGLGEHTREVLTELGYAAERIDVLHDAGAVASGGPTTTREST
ncbi:CaiB/BaiF CoA transferase family protein [Pseudonocardia alni]|uniref:CaiB/BaiF CoA transferase family protein n=1 Tax=Pseudonocardia alni TaxID=33907 RepID=UPI00332B5A1A